MKFSNEIEAFMKNFIKDLLESNVAIFAGAGMSKSSGYVDWPELLRDIAEELGLQIEKEQDLVSLAQYHVNHIGSSAGIVRKILEEFSAQAEPSESHEILARLPIRTFWTTNYDTLIEDALKRSLKIGDVKHNTSQLNNTRPKRDAVIYKMHGDISDPAHAIITKEQYERYHQTHSAYVTALSGDLVSKTFLFIGFSFTDPNLDYVLSRLHVSSSEASSRRQHYCFMRRELVAEGDDVEVTNYKNRKQELRIIDLKRYGIQALLVDNYSDVPKVLSEIERRFRKRTIFISGSAEEFGDWDRTQAQNLVHSLAKSLVEQNLRVVTGFGWGIGSAIINGALEAIYSNSEKFSEDQLVMRPFPQFASNKQDLTQLWEGYRQRMISLSGIAIFLFGNKPDVGGGIIEANGVLREFEIAAEQGVVPIPVGVTEYASRSIWNIVSADPSKYYDGIPWIMPMLQELADPAIDHAAIKDKVIAIIRRLAK